METKDRSLMVQRFEQSLTHPDMGALSIHMWEKEEEAEGADHFVSNQLAEKSCSLLGLLTFANIEAFFCMVRDFAIRGIIFRPPPSPSSITRRLPKRRDTAATLPLRLSAPLTSSLVPFPAALTRLSITCDRLLTTTIYSLFHYFITSCSCVIS